MDSMPPGRDDSQLPPAETDTQLAAVSVSARRGTRSSVSTPPDHQLPTAARTQSLRTAVNDNTALDLVQQPADTTQAHAPVIEPNVNNFDDDAYKSGSEMGEIREPQYLDPELFKEQLTAYRTGPLEPPVSLESLGELDFVRILINPKLRADVNFDRDLHFRADVEGSRGKQKIQDSKEFWMAIDYELCAIGKIQELRVESNELAEDARLKSHIRIIVKRLPKVLAAVRDILVSLVPEREQAGIKDHLNVDFIVQQIIYGVCDFRKIVTWLAGIIKTHCAPMRDETVDKIQLTVSIALDVLDNSQLADGLRRLVDLMEAMKLDVANHQIRQIRPLLIKSTVDFQRKYSKHCIRTGKIDIDPALAWLQSELDLVQGNVIPPTPLDALCSALLWDMISPQGAMPYVQTFHLDFERLKLLSNELRNTLDSGICMKNLGAYLLPTASNEYMEQAYKRFNDFLADIMRSPDWKTTAIRDIAFEIVRIVTAVPDTQIDQPAKFERNVRNRLRRDLSSLGEVFARAKAQLFHRILPKVQEKVKANVDVPPLKLHDIFLPLVIRPSRPIDGFGAILRPPMPVVVFDEDSHTVNKLSHIICLHWQVWGQTYLDNTNHEYQDGPPFEHSMQRDDEDDEDDEETMYVSRSLQGSISHYAAHFQPGSAHENDFYSEREMRDHY